jgi:hypothetical protein
MFSYRAKSSCIWGGAEDASQVERFMQELLHEFQNLDLVLFQKTLL